MKLNGLLLFPVVLILIVLVIQKPKSNNNWQPLSYASLHDTLPTVFFEKVKTHEIQGYRVSKDYKNIYYFEYTANHSDVLQALSSLPFAADSIRADIQARVITGERELKQVTDLLKEQHIINNFSINLHEFIVYECLKSPQHHFVLLNKNSNQVIHIINQG